MTPATERRPAGVLALLLAGLQGGMLGACWMLAWLGLSASWQRRSFWTAENLMATAFYGGEAIRGEFAGRTLSGLALYLLIYSLLGAVFALALRDRLPHIRIFLLGLVFALAWYYMSFRLFFRTAIPLVALLHAVRPTIVGHLVYGTFLGRYPVYLPQPAAPSQVEPAAETPVPAIPESGQETLEP